MEPILLTPNRRALIIMRTLKRALISRSCHVGQVSKVWIECAAEGLPEHVHVLAVHCLGCWAAYLCCFSFYFSLDSDYATVKPKNTYSFPSVSSKAQVCIKSLPHVVLGSGIPLTVGLGRGTGRSHAPWSCFQ